MKIKDIKFKETYKSLVFTNLMSFFNDNFFKPLYKTLNYKASNTNSLIKDALLNGVIIYQDGVFKPVKKLSNDLSLHFEKLGAKWDKTLKGYSFKFMPDWLLEEVQITQKIHLERMVAIDTLLQDFAVNIDNYIDTMIFDEEVFYICKDGQEQVRKNIKHLNIIEPELSEQQIQNIADNYTNNIKLSIKNWTGESILKMRQQVQQLILGGWREADVKKILTTQYYNELLKSTKLPKDINKADLKLIIKKQQIQAMNKAKFLAQNETSLLLAQIKKEMYREMGFKEFKWVTILDGRERLEHYKLNGKIFSFDNPPIIDERIGQRGLPGEAFGCRCSMIPIRRDSVFDSV